MASTLLRDTDSVSMARSLEVRVPLLDTPLVEFVTALPDDARHKQEIEVRNQADSMHYQAEKLLYAAKVRNGFVPLVRREVAKKFKGLEIDTCPFADLPEKKRTQWALTKEEMKNCVWLKPELIAQIEFTEWTLDNHLRHSKFAGLREDKEAREVVRED